MKTVLSMADHAIVIMKDCHVWYPLSQTDQSTVCFTFHYANYFKVPGVIQVVPYMHKFTLVYNVLNSIFQLALFKDINLEALNCIFMF